MMTDYDTAYGEGYEDGVKDASRTRTAAEGIWVFYAKDGTEYEPDGIFGPYSSEREAVADAVAYLTRRGILEEGILDPATATAHDVWEAVMEYPYEAVIQTLLPPGQGR